MVLTVSPGNARRRYRSSAGQNSNERPHDVSPKPAKLISSRQPTRLMVGLIYLKHSYNLSDEQVLFGGSCSL